MCCIFEHSENQTVPLRSKCSILVLCLYQYQCWSTLGFLVFPLLYNLKCHGVRAGGGHCRMGPGKFFVFLLEQPKTFPTSIFHLFLLFGCWVVKIPIVPGSITHTNVIKCLPTGLKRAFLPNPQYSAHLSTSQHFSTVFEAPRSWGSQSIRAPYCRLGSTAPSSQALESIEGNQEY